MTTMLSLAFSPVPQERAQNNYNFHSEGGCDMLLGIIIFFLIIHFIQYVIELYPIQNLTLWGSVLHYGTD